MQELEAIFTRLQEVAFGADGGSYSGASASVGASGDTPGGVTGGGLTDASGGAVGVGGGGGAGGASDGGFLPLGGLWFTLSSATFRQKNGF
jgi:hypothetical protein